MTLRTFISYAREDRAACDELFGFLDQLGLAVFRDVDSLKGGELWHADILREAEQAELFVFLASASSVDKPGMIQEELAVARRRLDSDQQFQFLAIRLDQAPLQEWMLPRQYLNWEDPALIEKLVDRINRVHADAGNSIASPDGKAYVNQRPPVVQYSTPGCEYSYSVPSIAIVGEPFATIELNHAIRGKVAQQILDMRGWVEEGGREGHSDIIITPIGLDFSAEFIGLSFEYFAYFGRAAHPQHHFLTINIRRRPWSLKNVAVLPERKERLVELVIRDLPDEPDALWEPDMLRNGLMRYDFAANVIFVEGGVRLYFGDYALGPYVTGARAHDFSDPEIRAILLLE